MTTFQEKNLSSGSIGKSRILHAARCAVSGIFFVKSIRKCMCASSFDAGKLANKISKPYFSAISGICVECLSGLSCTFASRPGSIRFADSDRALASANTQPETAVRILPKSETLFLNKSNYEQQRCLFKYTPDRLYLQRQKRAATH